MIKECKICKISKPVKEFHTCGKYKEIQYYRGECMQCSNDNRRGKNLEYHKEYRNRPEIKEKRLRYKKQEKSKNQARIRGKERYHNDPVYKLKKCLRTRIIYALKAQNWVKHNSTPKIVGCSYEEFKKYIESQFHSGMTWENHGEFWEIEHIKALGFAITEEELYKLCHFSNIRPYLKEEHKIKTKIDTKEIKKIKMILRKI